MATDQTSENNAWLNDTRSTFTYDSKKRIKTLLTEDWDIISNVWVNTSLLELSYTSVCTLVLPLTLLNFEATNSNENIFLKWETTNEINTSALK